MKRTLLILCLIISAAAVLPRTARAQIPDTFFAPIANGNSWNYNYQHKGTNVYNTTAPSYLTVYDTVKTGVFQVSMNSVNARNDSVFFAVVISETGAITYTAVVNQDTTSSSSGYSNGDTYVFLVADSILFRDSLGVWVRDNPWYLSFLLQTDTSYSYNVYQGTVSGSRSTTASNIIINGSDYQQYNKNVQDRSTHWGISNSEVRNGDNFRWVNGIGDLYRSCSRYVWMSSTYSTTRSSDDRWTLSTYNSIVIPPPAPSQVFPSNGATDIPVSLSLVWNNVCTASGYHIQLAADTAFSVLTAEDSLLTDTLMAISGLANSTVYFWRVRAKNAGGVSPWSSCRRFTTAPVPPETPVLTSPTNISMNQPISLTLYWNSSARASSYHVQVATDTGFTSVFMRDSSITGTARALSGLTGSTAYFWRVRAKNAGGVSGWSAVWSFTTAAPPAAPLLVFPLNGATGQPLSLSLNWNVAATASSYYVQTATDSGFTSIVVNDSMLADTLKDVSGLSYNTYYYWRIRAKNTGGVSPWSEIWKFSTIVPPAPATPTLVSPPDSAKGLPLALSLIWNKVYLAACFHLQIAFDTGFTSLFSENTSLADSIATVNGLVIGTSYYWRVRARNAGGESGWSETWSFSTETPPPVPTLVSPADSAVDQLFSQTFTWNAVAAAANYHIQVATDTDFVNLLLRDSSIVDSFKNVNGLAGSTTYYWRVRAKNAGGVSGWSEMRCFTTATPPPAPLLQSPDSGVVDQPRSFFWRWTSSPGASSYHIQVSTNAAFMSVFIDEPSLADTLLETDGLTYSQTYYWRVSAVNAIGAESEWSNVWKFTTIIAAPETPSLDSPADGAVGLGDSVILSWNIAARASNYQVQVASDTGFAILLKDSVLFQGHISIAGLATGTTFYWRLRAINIGGTSAWSEVRSFTMVNTGVIPKPPSPTTAFSISGSFNVVRYTLPTCCFVSLKYYDLRGRLVASLINTSQGAGYYVLPVRDALPSCGTYIVHFKAGNESVRFRMVVDR